MRVALVRELGGIGRVELRERPDPTPSAGQAVVRVRGAGVGPWDVAMISGAFGRPALPYIPGFEVAGVVEAVGYGADVQPGDRVYANLGVAPAENRSAAMKPSSPPANRLFPQPQRYHTAPPAVAGSSRIRPTHSPRITADGLMNRCPDDPRLTGGSSSAARS